MKREIRHFHVMVVQKQWQRNVEKSGILVMPVQIVVFLIKPIVFDDLVPLTLPFLAKQEGGSDVI